MSSSNSRKENRKNRKEQKKIFFSLLVSVSMPKKSDRLNPSQQERKKSVNERKSEVCTRKREKTHIFMYTHAHIYTWIFLYSPNFQLALSTLQVHGWSSSSSSCFFSTHIKKRYYVPQRSCLFFHASNNLHVRIPWKKKHHRHNSYNNIEENAPGEDDWERRKRKKRSKKICVHIRDTHAHTHTSAHKMHLWYSPFYFMTCFSAHSNLICMCAECTFSHIKTHPFQKKCMRIHPNSFPSTHHTYFCFTFIYTHIFSSLSPAVAYLVFMTFEKKMLPQQVHRRRSKSIALYIFTRDKNRSIFGGGSINA